MKSYDEVTSNLLDRRNKYNEAQKAKKKTMVHISFFVSCIVAVAVLGIGIRQGGWLDFNLLSLSNPSSQEGSNTESTRNHATDEKTTDQATITSNKQPTSIQNTSTPHYEGTPSDGNIGGQFIPILPLDKEIKTTGEVITDAEAKEYFNKNKNSIASCFASSGISSNTIKISDKGYCHVNYDGEEGKSFEVRQNYRDYLVYNSNKLIAIITLWKEHGEIFNTPSFGAEWFDDYNAYLKAHKGEKLVFAYAGWLEIIIAPDNTYFNPLGYDVSAYLKGIKKPYEIFYHEAATFTP